MQSINIIIYFFVLWVSFFTILIYSSYIYTQHENFNLKTAKNGSILIILVCNHIICLLFYLYAPDDGQLNRNMYCDCYDKLTYYSIRFKRFIIH
jgi:hypothetical protein